MPLLISGQQIGGIPTGIAPLGSGLASEEKDPAGAKLFTPAKFDPTVNG